MELRIIIVLILSFAIYLISNMAYGARIAGVEVRQISLSLSIFNILALLSRTANMFQIPLLAKMVDNNATVDLLSYIRLILLIGIITTIFSIILLPTWIHLFKKGIKKFKDLGSMPKLMLYGVVNTHKIFLKENIIIPSFLKYDKNSFKDIPKKVLLLNIFATTFGSVGFLSALYAAALFPELRTTCMTLSPLINGISTIILFIMVDPIIARLSDDTLNGEISLEYFKKINIMMMVSTVFGIFLGQFAVVPAAHLIGLIANII